MISKTESKGSTCFLTAVLEAGVQSYLWILLLRVLPKVKFVGLLKVN